MTRVNAIEIADSAKIRGFHLSLFIWCFVLLVLDGYDLAIAGAVLPSIMKEWGVSPSTAGFMASSALFGMMAGAIVLGTLADRFGRRSVIAASVTLFSLFTAAAGLCSDPVSFSVCRFLAGIGLGGAIPNIVSHSTEYSPKRVRGALVCCIGCGYPVGSVLAAVAGKQFVEAYGWQFVFLLAATPLVLVPMILKFVPESLTFLVKRGDLDAAANVLARLAPDVKVSASTLALPATEDRALREPIGSLFRDGRALSTSMIWIAFITTLFLLYSVSTWLVKLMVNAGFSLGSAQSFLIIYNVGAVVGAAVGGWLADRSSMKRVLVSFYVLAAVSLCGLGYGGAQPVLVAWVALLGAASLGSQLLVYAYTGQFYPSIMRTTGVGFAAGVGRIGGIAAPIIIGFLVSMNWPLAQNFFAIAAVATIGALAVSFVDERRSAAAPMVAAEPTSSVESPPGKGALP